jgi:uncharacterized membrane protein YbhN (UPF0104 family)
MAGKKVWIGLAVSAIALYLALRGLQFDQLWLALKAGHYGWLLVAMPFYLVGYYSRATRVAQLLEPIKPVPSGRILPPLVIGFLFNNILPGRLGELVFAYLLGKREGISRTASFAVIVLSRVLDGITIVAFFLFGLFAFMPIGGPAVDVSGMAEVAGVAFSKHELLGKVYYAGILGGILFGLVSAACFVLIAWQALAMRVLDKMLMVFPPRFSQAGKAALERFIGGLGILKDPGRLFRVFVFNFVPWGLELFTYYFTARVFGLDLTIRECALIMGMTNLAMIVPGAPGGLGLFETGGMIVMALLSIEKAPAFAYIGLVHLIILLPINVWGAWFLWREGISFSDALAGSRDEKRHKEKR